MCVTTETRQIGCRLCGQLALVATVWVATVATVSLFCRRLLCDSAHTCVLTQVHLRGCSRRTCLVAQGQAGRGYVAGCSWQRGPLQMCCRALANAEDMGCGDVVDVGPRVGVWRSFRSLCAQSALSAADTYASRGASGVALAPLPRVRLGRVCDVWRPAALSGRCFGLVIGGFGCRVLCPLLCGAFSPASGTAVDCCAACALFRAPCESVLLSCPHSPSWPSRLRCRVSVVTHMCHPLQAEPRNEFSTCSAHHAPWCDQHCGRACLQGSRC